MVAAFTNLYARVRVALEGGRGADTPSTVPPTMTANNTESPPGVNSDGNEDEGDEMDHFEGLARDLLADDLDEDFDTLVLDAHRDLLNNLRNGGDGGVAIRRFACKAAEFTELAVNYYGKAHDVQHSDPGVYLTRLGSDLLWDMAETAGWLSAVEDGREPPNCGGSRSTTSPAGSPEAMAKILREAWQELDDAAREHGEPLPKELKPPRDGKGVNDGGN